MKKCFLCGLGDSIIEFNQKSFENCSLKLLFRREKKFANGEIRLTSDSLKSVGYHSSCYKKVTVLSKKYKNEYLQFCKNHVGSTVSINPDQQIAACENSSSSQISGATNVCTVDANVTEINSSDCTMDVSKGSTVSINPDQQIAACENSSSSQISGATNVCTVDANVTEINSSDCTMDVSKGSTVSINPDQQIAACENSSSSQNSGAPNVSTIEANVTEINSSDCTMDLSKVPYEGSSSEIHLDSPSMTLDRRALSDPLVLSGTSSYLEPEFDVTSDQATSSQRLTTNNEVVCLFCNISRKKKSGQQVAFVIFPKSEATITQLRKTASTLDDSEILYKLDNQIIAYHPACFSSYQVRMKRQAEEHADTNWHKEREIHKLAFNSLATFIEQEIINKHKIMYMRQLFSRYKSLLLEFSEGKKDPDDFAFYRCDYLEKKISDVFGDRLTIEVSTGSCNKKIIYLNDMDVPTLVSQAAKLEEEEDSKFEKVAYYLRHCVKSMPNRKLPSHLTVDDVLKGECDIPEQLYEFMYRLIVGPDTFSNDSNQMSFKIKSLCSDIIYQITKGRVKPEKNINLGLAMKSLTNSRQVLTILNRHGHTIGYNLAEELETEMTYAAVEENNVIPSGINAVPGQSTHIAFDNFDRFVDTVSGKDTMHDTVGIIYQFSTANNQNSDNIRASTSSTFQNHNYIDELRPPTRKRRRFNQISRGIRPYYQKPTAAMELLTIDSIEGGMVACKGPLNVAIEKDLLWIMSLARLDAVPMWLGYNCMVTTDNNPIQTVHYLPPINSSPTSYAIVNETLIVANDIAEKCNENFIIVTYDLAIAKMALQIQANEKPKYDNIFINLGAFHTQMALFKAIGKYIDGSGLVNVLVQAEVLAGGSINSFLDSKHFNRCKRLHPLTSAALQILHFEQYLSKHELNPELLDGLLQISKNQTVNIVGYQIDLPELLRKVVDGYKEYCKKTLLGKHGKTAQYYLQYCEFINLFLRFSRSIRCSDFELYIDSIYNMSDLFFSLNQPNYARWSVMYANNLIKAQNSNTRVASEFRRGAFGIRRTKSHFSRSPVDLALEQTINADASNQLTYNLAAESISARQRWALSHSIRTKIISTVKEHVGLSQKDDICHALQQSRINKDNESLQNIIKTIRNTVNPFVESIDKNVLFNITTGKAASTEVSDFLINVKSIGNQQKLTFIAECNSTPGRFEKPIKRNQILNFASQSAAKTQTSKDKTQKAVLKMERNIFGRLLAISIEKDINIEYCLTFPLAPVPPALFSYTGEFLKTDKSKLAKILKSNVETGEPTGIDIEIIDGFYYLYSIGPSLPLTFDKVAESILIKLCSTNASKIHIIFDRHITPSIKDCERKSRLEFDIPYVIQGPLQPRPNDFLGHLKNYSFKEALVLFLANYWENDHLVTIIQNKTVFITVGEHCFSYRADGNHIVKREEKDYFCQHEEADTRIMYHISKLPPHSKIMVKANDTDVLVILLATIHKIPQNQIWLASASSKKRNNKDVDCINCTELAIKLGRTLCLGLPGFHAFTGCDYTACFYNKGKLKPFQIFAKRTDFQEIFASLTDPADVLLEDKVQPIQEFTALLYGIKQCFNINDARYQIFQKTYSMHRNKDNFIKKIKGIDSNLLPPCWTALKQKILRTIFVTSMWQNATDVCCVKVNPEDCGWVLDGYLKPTWFEGDPTPLQVGDIIKESEHQENNEALELEFDFDIGTSDESESE